MRSREVVRQAVQAPDEASDVPLDHIVDGSEGHLGVVEDLSAAWRDDELLNALGRVDKHTPSVTWSFDASADWQLVELLLAWDVGSEPRGGVPAVKNNQGISPVTGQGESDADRRRAVPQQHAPHDLGFWPPAICRGRTP